MQGILSTSCLHTATVDIPSVGTSQLEEAVVPAHTTALSCETVQGCCVNTVVVWCQPWGKLWSPHCISLEVFPSWQAGTDGRRRNSLFLSWWKLFNSSPGAVGWSLTLVSVFPPLSTAGPFFHNSITRP